MSVKKVAVVFLAILIAGAGVFLATRAKSELGGQYLPEVVQIIEAKKQSPSMEQLKQDRYAVTLAFDAPADMDYKAIGAQVILNNYEAYMDDGFLKESGAVKSDAPKNHYGESQPLELLQEVDGVEYSFPCEDLRDFSCVETVLAQKESIAYLLAKNDVLLDRYLDVVQLPDNHDCSYLTFDPWPNYTAYVVLGNWRLGQALIAFDAGDAEEGFRLMQDEQKINHQMMVSGGNIGEVALGAKKYYTYLNVLSAMMEEPKFKAYMADPRMEALLAPITTQVVGAIQTSLTLSMRSTFYIVDATFAKAPYLYNHHAMNNIHYLLFDQAMQRASLSLPEVSAMYIQGEPVFLNGLDEERQNLIERWQKEEWNLIRNWITPKMISVASQLPDNSTFFRFYNLQQYQALVQLKYDIIQNNITHDGIDAYLEKVEAKSLITQTPVQWDAKEQVLKVDWLQPDRLGKSRNEKLYMEVFIAF